ncbi:MAG: hypothetical protein K5695_18035, partial [Oscillospiraceae bacterium]|nr:hypothetical protein [Oscillospiraceae bacterium]
RIRNENEVDLDGLFGGLGVSTSCGAEPSRCNLAQSVLMSPGEGLVKTAIGYRNFDKWGKITIPNGVQSTT